MRASPAAETPISGHGFGLRWQNCRKSCAKACGRIARLACTKPGARPDVGPECALRRIASRAARLFASASEFSRRMANVAIGHFLFVPPRSFCPFYHQAGKEKAGPTATILHAAPRPTGQTGLANSVETKVKIAFANGRNGATKARSGPAHGPGYSSRRNMR